MRSASIAAANLSVVSAFAFMIDGGSQQGWLMLIPPFGILLGYYLLRRLLAWANADGRLMSAREGSLLLTINDGASRPSAPSLFGRVVTWHWTAVYVLFAAFELVIAAKLVALLFGVKAGTVWEFLVATLMFVAAFVYTQCGGIRSVMQVDWVQLVVAGVSVFVLVLWVLGHVSAVPLLSALPSTASPWFVLQIFVMAIATQFFNPFNWHSPSVITHDSIAGEAAQRESDRVLKWGAILTVIVLEGLGVSGWLLSGGRRDAPMFWLVDAVATSAPALQALLVAAIIALTISTVDGVIVAVAANWYQTTVRSRTGDSIPHTPTSSRELGSVRKVLLLLYGFGALPLIAFFAFAPPGKVVTVVVLIASGGTVLFPLLVLAVYLYRTGHLLRLNNRAVGVFVALFWACWLISALAFLTVPSWVETVPLLFTTLAGVVAVAIAAFPGARHGIAVGSS